MGFPCTLDHSVPLQEAGYRTELWEVHSNPIWSTASGRLPSNHHIQEALEAPLQIVVIHLMSKFGIAWKKSWAYLIPWKDRNHMFDFCRLFSSSQFSPPYIQSSFSLHLQVLFWKWGLKAQLNRVVLWSDSLTLRVSFGRNCLKALITFFPRHRQMAKPCPDSNAFKWEI